MAAVNRENVRNEIRLLALDYVDYRLRQNGIDWPNRPAEILPEQPSEHATIMRAICDQFVDRLMTEFDDDRELLASLSVSSRDDLSTTFLTVCDSCLFRRDNQDAEAVRVTWGRIFALFAFGGSLAVECADRGELDMIDHVAELLVNYATTNVADWVAGHGGWPTLVQVYEQNQRRQQLETETNNSISRRALGGLSAVCGALGVAALAALIVARH